MPRPSMQDSAERGGELDSLIIGSALDFAIIGMDLARTVIRWSRGAETVLGWTAQEAMGQSADIIFTSEDRAAGVPEIEKQQSIADGRSMDERWHLRKDQTRFWGSGEMMPLHARDGSCIGSLKIVRDRTERWLADQKRLTLARLGEGLANMVDPSEMAELASELIRSALDVSGAAYASMVRDPHLEGLAIASAARVSAADVMSCIRTYVDSGEVHSVSVRAGNGRCDGTSICAHCMVPLYEAGKLVAIVAVVSEVQRVWTQGEIDFVGEIATRSRLAIERRRAEDDLRELAGTLEKQVERRLAERNRFWANTRDLMVIVDSHGRFQEWNPAWALLGWNETDLAGKRMMELTDEEGAKILRQALAGGATESTQQINLKSKAGPLRRLEWTISRDAEVAYLVGRDVTDQLEIEARLRQSQKMEAIGQLTGGIAHDFNNVLLGITGSLDLLRLCIERNRRDDIDRHIQTARTAAHRAAALTQRLLAFARQQPIDTTPVDVNRLVAGMEELLRRTLQARIRLELKLDATGLVLIDPHQLENAILNLVINSRDAMPRGGEILIATGNSGPDKNRKAASTENGRRYVCVSVADNGDGIPPDIVSRVFDPFFTTKPAGQGTGLGLAMIYGFVQQMNGDIELQTELGKGTTVRMYFPSIKDPPEPTVEVRYRPAKRGDGERIVVVEDDEDVRNTITEMLNEIGYSAVGVENAKQAVCLLESQDPVDLLITDWELPGVDGGELAEQARHRRNNLPICFLTGIAGADAAISSLRPHERLLTKPIGIESLAQLVAEMLEGRN